MKRTARRAPRAKVSRLCARCVSSRRSPGAPNDTVCSPTTSPERNEKTPISLRVRSPGNPWRPYTADAARSRPSASATTSAIRTAVPLGASFLPRWWISVISTSYSSPSALAIVASRRSASVTPTDMFGDNKIAALLLRSRISSRCRGENPVVPMTARTPAPAAIRTCSRVASGVENSTSSRPAVSAAAAPAAPGPPRRPRPATSPASAPSAEWPDASRAATRRKSGASPMQAMMRAPIRPAAPATTMSTMCDVLALRRLLHEAVRLQDGAQPLAIGVGHAAHGQPELRLEHARHRHRFLDRNRIRLQERGAGQRVELVVELARALEVAVERGVHHVGGLARHDVGDDRDHAAAANRHQRQGQVVVARQHDEVGATGTDDLAHLVEGARRFLDTDDVPAVARDTLERRRLDVHRRPALDVVDEDRQRRGLGDRAEVAVEALLRGPGGGGGRGPRASACGSRDSRRGRRWPGRALRAS